MKNFFIIGAVVLCVAFVSCQSAKKEQTFEHKALVIIPTSRVQDDELTITTRVLEENGIDAVVACPEMKTVDGMLGGSFKPEIIVKDANLSEYEMIVFIGGEGAFGLFDNTEMHAIIQDFDKQEKIVAAICAAPGILANAGVLNGKDATCYPYEPISDLLKSKGANYLDKLVVVSGRVITGNGAEASQAFGEALVNAITG